jgi:hypothetical protein
MDPYNKNLVQEKAKKEHNRFLGNASGRVMGGIVILIFGTLLLVDEVGFDLPRWIFTWKTLLIGFGLFLGARHNFKSWGWVIPIGIGVVFLAEDILDDFYIRADFIWPVAIITLGLFMIFRKSKKASGETWQAPITAATSTGPDQGEVLDTVAIFGSSKKNILSKNFRGGEVVSVFGGADLNFMQADIQGVAVLDVTTIFGGAKLVVPGNWTIKSELVSILGGTEDKRQMLTEADPNKVLVLEGTVLFGGIEIKSY